MKTVFANYQCDFCDKVVAVELDQRQKDMLPPGWGVLLFTVRPATTARPRSASEAAASEEWSKGKYHACSRACALEIAHRSYPRDAR